MIDLTFEGKIQGAGAPNYLNGAYDVAVANIAGNRIAAVISFDGASLSLFNVDDSTNPILTDTIQGAGAPNYLDGASKIKIKIIGGTEYAIVTSYNDNALTIFDISDPSTIVHSGEIVDGGGSTVLEGVYGLDLAAIGGTEYALVTSMADAALVVIDIDNPAAPVEIDNISGVGSPNYLDGAHGVVVASISANWYALVVGFYDNSLSIFDIDNPAAIALSDAVTGSSSPNYLGGAHSIDFFIADGSQYVAISSYYEDSVVIYDVSNPAAVSYVSRIAEGQSPNWLEEPTCILTPEIGGIPLVIVTGYLDDSLNVFDASDPTNLSLLDTLQGAGAPNYLGGAHGLTLDTDNIFITSYNIDTLSIFSLDVHLVPNSVTMAATTSVSATCHVGGDVAATCVMAATTYVRTKAIETTIDWSIFDEEIKKPHWYPIVRAYALDSSNIEIEITDKVRDFDRVLWQIEQHVNDFTASNCRLDLKNENEDFDAEKNNNYFTRVLGRGADGYKVPVVIKVGYKIVDTEYLIPLFYGLIVGIDTTTKNDVAVVDLQCVSRILRDAVIKDFGDLWTDQQLYGGRSWTHVSNPFLSYGSHLAVEGDNFPDNFPPNGYIKIEDEIIYYGAKLSDGFGDCLRGRLGTTSVTHVVGSLVVLLMSDGSSTEGRFFQFPIYPLSEDSISSISSSDGDIALYNKQLLINIPYDDMKKSGFVDYENGILELGAEPTDSGSVVATYKTCPRNWTYPYLVKKLLENEGFSIALIEDVDLSNMLGNPEPVNYGRITHAWSGETMGQLESTDALALASDANGNIYIGVGGAIIKWDGERYTLLADIGTSNYIFRMGVDINGNIYGICGIHEYTPVYTAADLNTPKNVFKFDGESITFLAEGVAAYFDWDSIRYEGGGVGIEGAQWKGLSIDDDNSCVWFLYEDSGYGIAKINFDGTGYTKYARGVSFRRCMDFVDSGNYIEFFYDDAGGVQYDRLNKGAGTWAAVGEILPIGGYDAVVPIDVAYNPDDGNIYLNCLGYVISLDGDGNVIDRSWDGEFVSTPLGSAVETTLATYTYGDSRWVRYSGLVYSDSYIWCVYGTGISQGKTVDLNTGQEMGDLSTGHLYRIANDVLEDMGALAWRPPSDDTVFIRTNVKGHTAVLTANPVNNSIFFLASDATVDSDETYGYSFGMYSDIYVPIVRIARLNNMMVWDILSELAMLVNHELGVSREGDVFWRQRVSTYTQLNGNINDAVTTITCDGTFIDQFPSSGIMQIGQEVITYIGKAGNDFTGCVRGCWDSTAAGHEAPATIWEIEAVITSELAHEKTLKFAKKQTMWDEIYNYIEVPFGNFVAICDWEKVGEVWEDSSEFRYGRRPFRVDNIYLTSDDVAFAEAIAWRYYDQYHLRRVLLELETKWQPQLDLGDMVSVRQDSRVLLTYDISRIRRIEVMMRSAAERFFVRILAVVRPSRYRSNVYEYPYEYHDF